MRQNLLHCLEREPRRDRLLLGGRGHRPLRLELRRRLRVHCREQGCGLRRRLRLRHAELNLLGSLRLGGRHLLLLRLSLHRGLRPSTRELCSHAIELLLRRVEHLGRLHVVRVQLLAHRFELRLRSYCLHHRLLGLLHRRCLERCHRLELRLLLLGCLTAGQLTQALVQQRLALVELLNGQHLVSFGRLKLRPARLQLRMLRGELRGSMLAVGFQVHKDVLELCQRRLKLRHLHPRLRLGLHAGLQLCADCLQLGMFGLGMHLLGRDQLRADRIELFDLCVELFVFCLQLRLERLHVRFKGQACLKERCDPSVGCRTFCPHILEILMGHLELGRGLRLGFTADGKVVTQILDDGLKFEPCRVECLDACLHLGVVDGDCFECRRLDHVDGSRACRGGVEEGRSHEGNACQKQQGRCHVGRGKFKTESRLDGRRDPKQSRSVGEQQSH